MVIFGKKKVKQLLRRIDNLELELKHYEVLFNSRTKRLERLEEGVARLAEKLNEDEKKPKLTPQQLMREWYFGEEGGN